MANQPRQKMKGNPASKRMLNTLRKTARASSWLSHKQVVEIRKAAQEAAHKRNQTSGDPSPWELAKARRKARRDTDPGVRRRREEHRVREMMERESEIRP